MNQLPDVRRFVLGRGNADGYVGIRINFVPHHHPYLIMFNEDGSEGEWTDLAPMSYQDLTNLFEKHGFKRKVIL